MTKTGAASGTKQDGASSLATIVNHPLRAKMWFILTERNASPMQLSRMLDESLNSCAYHCRVLEKAGLIEVVEEIPRRGAIEHVWRGIQRPAFDTEEVATWTDAEKRENATVTCQMAFADHVRALEADTFTNRDDYWVARLAGRLDERGFAEVSAAFYALLDSFFTAEANTKVRIAAGESEETMPVSGLASIFEVPDRVHG